ncbi:DEAD/DEAH box helicase [Paucilactobacillus wasatchensis]|uniref:Helicase, Snf2 family n=1 Tax=Paucilactobacillus wasatchensis TaxID=1335616 RepID=A0A0D1A6Y7_9LACO|nr:SNF2-related protein [Paucilactobacillus wasatchensis]KIS03605.1 helicase, Snf2 family [Paucilactobacillus wasatchensis]
MKKRTMAAKYWQRGRAIAAAGNVTIEDIDRSQQTAQATVYGTHPYHVYVRERLNQFDDCDCPFFEGNGYCKHVAAVIELLKQQKRPIEELFDSGVEPIDDATDFGKTKSADTFRFFRDRETRMGDESGQLFLEDLKLPSRRYFELPSANEVDHLTIEVTLEIAEVYQSISAGHFQNRFFLSLRVADIAEQKFYVVNNINLFLEAYQTETGYKTGGKRIFELRGSVFAKPERELLDYLILAGQEPVVENAEFDKAKYFLLPTNSVQQVLKKSAELPNFRFHPVMGQPYYHQIEQKKFAPDDGLLLGKIETVADGYNLTIKTNLQLYVEANMLAVNENQIYQLNLPQMKTISQILDRYHAVTDEMRRYQWRLKEASDASVLHFPAGSETQLNKFVELFKTVGIMTAPEELFVSDMTPHFDLNKNEDQLELQLSFEYSTDESAPVRRNLAKEKQAQRYLLNLDFTSINNDNHWQKEFVDAEVMYDFIVRELPNLRQNGIVTISDELQNLVNDATELIPNINVAETGGFLTIEFSVAGIGEDEVDGILEQLEDVQRPYIERPDGSILVVDESFKKVSAALVKIRQQGKIKNGKVQVHASQALAIQAALGDSAQFDQKFQQLTVNLAHPEKFRFEQIKPVNANLRPYQTTGIKWLEMLDSYNFGGILADEMGLGKTLQMIAFLINHLEADKTNLVVSPASLIYNWQAEFKKFAPAINVDVVDGTKENRRELINDSTADILITSYNSARSDIADYQKLTLNYLILDEAQYVKNSSTKTSQSLRKLTPKNTFALSGTPIENRVEELWSIFEIVMPGLLPSKKAFKKLMPQEVAVRVKPFIMRREKATVLTELPEKVESNLYNELTKEQKTVYLAQLKQMQVKVKGMSGTTFVKNKLEILAGLTRLRQICDTPALYLDDYRAESGKIEQLSEILRQAQDNNRHVLIFSQFTGMLDIIERKLTAQGLDTFMIQGNTKPKDRLAMVNAFNKGDKNIFLISLKAGGTGLNLTGADMVILVDLWWNPAVEDQATARAHRIGQKNKVDVFRLITKGTIEEQIYKLQEKKRNFVDQVLSGTENKGTLTEEEVRVILGI